MAFDIKSLFQQAIVANLNLWRRRVLKDSTVADQHWQQHEAIWEAVANGLEKPTTQVEAAALAVDVLPVLESWGVWFGWLPLLETASTLVLPPDLQVQVLLGQARINVLNRNFADALQQLQRALTIADKHQLTQLAARTHYRLTHAYLGQKAMVQAREHGSLALSLLPPTPSKTLAALLNAWGLIELESGEFAASERYFKRAIALWSELADPTQLARTYLNLGVVYQQQAQLTAAKACYMQAHTALAQTMSLVDQLKVLNGLGTLHYVLEEYEDAEKVFRQGLAGAQELQGVFHLRGSLTHNLGNTLLACERWGEAKLYLEKSLILWQQANDEVQQANSVGTLAELFEKRANWQTAVSYYSQALTLLARYPEQPWAKKLAETFRTARSRCAAQTAANKNDL